MRFIPKVKRFVVTGVSGFESYGETHTLGYARKLASVTKNRPYTEIWDVTRENFGLLEMRRLEGLTNLIPLD